MDKYLSSSSSSSSTCSSSSSSSSIDLYSSTIFNYLNESNSLEYLALADFTLRFPVVEPSTSTSSQRLLLPAAFKAAAAAATTTTSTVVTAAASRHSNHFNHQRVIKTPRRKKLKVSDEEEDEEDDGDDNDDHDSLLSSSSLLNGSSTSGSVAEDDVDGRGEQRMSLVATTSTTTMSSSPSPPSNLKYLFLRNIRNIKTLTCPQIENLRSFLQVQFNLHTLDLIGLYIDSKFICSILDNLNNLRVLHFGHGKSYKKNLTSTKYLINMKLKSEGGGGHSSQFDVNNTSYKYIDIDQINYKLAECCPMLTHLGIFYRQFELKFKRDPQIEFKNDSLINLLEKCSQLKQISYLKSFKIQEDDECDDYGDDIDDSDSDEDDDDDDDDDNYDDKRDMRKKKRKQARQQQRQHNNNSSSASSISSSGSRRKCRSYFHYIKYAIEHANARVNMKPCYGFDITPTSGHFLDFTNREFIETSLPIMRPPHNDFHSHLLR